MELGYMLVFLCCFILQADNYQLNKSLCEESLCLYLYEAGNTRLTWEQSHTACRDQGLEMLRIESSQTQTTVLPQYTIRLVWIGGRRSSDNTWRYMNWTEFDKTTTTTEPDLYPYCIHVNLCKDSSPQYIADNCDEKRSSSRVLCQYDKSRTGQCRSQDYQFGDKCYVKTQYDGSDPNRIDWYSGQTYCSQSPIQGDIAYSYLDDKQHINDVVSLLDDGDGCVVLWLGVRRRIWFWKTDSGSDTSGQVIDYFNWFDEDTPIPSSDDCIYIDGDKGNKWRVQNCTGSPLNYFICMNASTATTTTRTTTGTTTTTTTGTTTTTTTATTTISTTATTTTTTLIGIKATTLTTTTTANTTLTSYKIALIVTVLVCIVLMIVNIGQIVVWLRYRRQKSSKSSTVNQTEMSRNDVTSTQTTRSSALEQEVTQSGTYEEITVQTGQGHNT